MTSIAAFSFASCTFNGMHSNTSSTFVQIDPTKSINHRHARARVTVRTYMSTTSSSSPSPSTPSTETVTLTPKARELLQLQVAKPIFDPALLPSSQLQQSLAAAQPAKPPYSLLSDLNCVDNGAARVACAILTEDVVGAGRDAVLRSFDGIDQPGGKLYPEYRSDACWRDLLAFTRVASYVCACGGDDAGLSPDGFGVLQNVYDELDVPVDAVVTGVRGIWGHALCKAPDVVLQESTDVRTSDVCNILDKAFLALIERLSKLS